MEFSQFIRDRRREIRAIAKIISIKEKDINQHEVREKDSLSVFIKSEKR